MLKMSETKIYHLAIALISNSKLNELTMVEVVQIN